MTVKILVKGAVQGVGYRPFVLQKAIEYGLFGQVKNIGAAVEIIISGKADSIDEFVDMLKEEYPAGAFILDVQTEELCSNEYDFNEFSIVESTSLDLSSELPVFLPDIGICNDCLAEMLDSKNRRYRYPLISCASCGPRISILDTLPYDRETTVMSDFKMCRKCNEEYKLGRRRHAQTISCHNCGPQMKLLFYDNDNLCSLDRDYAVTKAIELLKSDKIIGLKGISGYQLLCKPEDAAALKLRQIKGRENKPFAVLFSDINSVKKYAKINCLEEELLSSSARPIVLLESIKNFPGEVCKDSKYIGAFLPSAGIHRLLCDALGPLICTSANISGRPMLIDDDLFIDTFLNSSREHIDGVLFHERRINQPQDDSVMFVIKGSSGVHSAQFIRRARGFSPLPVIIKKLMKSNSSSLCLGGDLKSTFSLAKKDRIIPSQFIGDLEDVDTYDLYIKLIKRYCDLFSFDPDKIICDKHPLYHSTKYGKRLSEDKNLELIQIQHHYAHTLSVMAENSLTSCIGVSFDGTGYGDDGKIWGGEILYCKGTKYERLSHLSYVKLLGGDNAPKDAELVKHCYDIGLGYEGKDIIKAAIYQNINTYETSSVGRLFDAVASLLGVGSYNSFEGECAINLEKKASESNMISFPDYNIKMSQDDGGMYIFDQLDLFDQIRKSINVNKYNESDIAYGFHIALAKYIVKTCNILREKTSEQNICLSGGVFANRILLENSIALLRENGFNVYWNRLVPAGDSGISLGQAYFGLLSEG